MNSQKHSSTSEASKLVTALRATCFFERILRNIPHEEVFRECTIFGIFFDSWVAKQDKQIDMRSCLSIASSSNDYENRTAGLRAQDVFENLFEENTHPQSKRTIK